MKASSPENLPNIVKTTTDAKAKLPEVTGWGGLGVGCSRKRDKKIDHVESNSIAECLLLI